MNNASNVLFWVGTGLTMVAFGCAVAENFIKNEKARKIVNWIGIGCILGGAACFVAHDVIG